jgi:hypothetical protein
LFNKNEAISLLKEGNIQPLLINEPALDLFLKRLVR